MASQRPSQSDRLIPGNASRILSFVERCDGVSRKAAGSGIKAAE